MTSLFSTKTRHVPELAPAAMGLGPLLLIGAVLASLPLFHFGLASLVDAWSIPEYSHGPIIPFISAFLFLREMRAVPPAEQPVSDRWFGVLVAAGALAIAALGNLVRVPDIVTYAIILWVFGLILVSFGFRRGLLFWPAVLHLFFMLPLPQVVYWRVSTYLQTVSSEIGVGVLQITGIPVFLDGNIIDLGVYKLQVAEACSGLRYLFPMLSFTYVFALLYRGPIWHKAILLVSAAPITVLMNSFRIGVIGVMVDNFGIEHAQGFLHAFEGWVIFIACIGILFLMTIVLQQLQREPRGLGESLDIEFAGLGGQALRLFSVVPSRALAVLAALTLASSLVWALFPEREIETVDRAPFAVFPGVVGEWTSVSRQTLDTEIERVLGADDYLAVTYRSPEAAAPVDLFSAFYHRQNEGSGIHSPEVCIPAGGWEVSQWRARQVPLESGRTLEVNRAIIQKGLNRQLVYYYFDQRGRVMANDYLAKLMTVWDSLVMGRTDGALVRVITPIGERESEAEADARLEEFLSVAMDDFARFIPR